MAHEISEAKRLELLKQASGIMALAADVYNVAGTEAPEGWRIVAKADPPPGDGAGFYARVYERIGPVPPGAAKYAVAFRGTKKISDIRDLKDDAEITLRRIPGQYEQGLAFVQRVCQENNINTAEMMFTGHSLGGYLAISVGETLGAKNIWAFDAPSPTQKTREKLLKKIPGVSGPAGDGLVHIRSIYDIIGKWGCDEGIIIGLKTSGFYHSLANLRQAVDAAISDGKPAEALVAPKKRSLSAVFNAISKRLATSRLANWTIRRLFGECVCPKPATGSPFYNPPHRPPPARPAFG
jgi:hypothetical protein